MAAPALRDSGLMGYFKRLVQVLDQVVGRLKAD
jgi:hypothetical protein